jgi:hypothetical protein
VNRYDFSSIVLVIIATIASGLVIQPANYNVLGELPSRSTWEPISSVTTDLTGASIMSTNSNSSQTGNTTMNIPSNDTILNSNITNKSSLNTTMPNQLPPESINGSRIPKI